MTISTIVLAITGIFGGGGGGGGGGDSPPKDERVLKKTRLNRLADTLKRLKSLKRTYSGISIEKC